MLTLTPGSTPRFLGIPSRPSLVSFASREEAARQERNSVERRHSVGEGDGATRERSHSNFPALREGTSKEVARAEKIWAARLNEYLPNAAHMSPHPAAASANALASRMPDIVPASRGLRKKLEPAAASMLQTLRRWDG